MKRNITFRLNAAFLLLVFASNTVIGVACAVGIDMGFNSHHHDEEAIEETNHVPTDGTMHHHHNEATKHHHDSNEDSEKGGCCNDKVIKFQDLDKKFVQNITVTAPEFVPILSNYSGIDIFKSGQVNSQKYIVRFFHPPPPDIRILIRSFQI